MKRLIFFTTISICLFSLTAFVAKLQQDKNLESSIIKKDLFDSEEILNIKITGNIRNLMKDRFDDPTYQELNFSYKEKDNAAVSFPVKIRTRGRFRRMSQNCTYPPLLLNFAKKNQTKESLFYKQDKMKLVMPCRGDEYVIKEWLLYKIYNLITEKSFRARLVRVELEDTERSKNNTSFYGVLLEEEEQMAERNKMIAVEWLKFQPENTQRDAFIKMAVFQYLIGNTDWSVQFLQNIKLLLKDSVSKNPIPVPYDFDHAGLVYAPYAQPFEELKMKSVRERRYRGYCIENINEFESTIELFNKLKPAIYKLYEDCTLIDARYKKSTINYFDEFYKTINDPKLLKTAFTYPCDPFGTGNVIIQGLKNN